MNCPHVVWALRQRGLSASERIVLIYLSDKANDAMVCWPTIPTIAAAVEIGQRTVYNAIDRLEQLGLIRIERQHRCNNHYHILRLTDSNTTDRRQPAVVTYPTEHQPEDGADFAPKPLHAGLAGKPCRQNLHAVEFCMQDLQANPAKPTGNGVVLHADFAVHPPKKERKKEKGVPPAREDDCAAVMNAWNTMAMAVKLPKVVAMTPDRRKHLSARLSEHGLSGVLAAVEAVGKSDFCRGKNDRKWVADFDFVLQPKACVRAIEGSYGNRTDSRANQHPLHRAMVTF